MNTEKGKKIKKVKNFAVLVFAVVSFVTTAYGIHTILLPDNFVLALLLSLGVQSLLLIINLQKLRIYWLLLLIPLLLISSGFSYAYYCEIIYGGDFYNQADKILSEKEEYVLSEIDVYVNKEKNTVMDSFYESEIKLENDVKGSDNIKDEFNKLPQNENIVLKEIYKNLNALSDNKTIDKNATETLLNDADKSIKETISQNNDTISRIIYGYETGDLKKYEDLNKSLTKQQQDLLEYMNFYNVFKGNSLSSVKTKANEIIKKINESDEIKTDEINRSLNEIRTILTSNDTVLNSDDYSNLMNDFNDFKSSVENLIGIYDLQNYTSKRYSELKTMDVTDYEKEDELIVWKEKWLKTIQDEKNKLRMMSVYNDEYKTLSNKIIDDLNDAERFYLYDINYIEKAVTFLTYHKYKTLAIVVLLLSIFFDTTGIVFEYVIHLIERKK